ncbi:MAG TPA: hypothetical protein VFZ03_00880, partial [Dongiaceae bacterium]
WKCPEAHIPFGSALILGVNCKGNASNLRGDSQCANAGGTQQLAPQPSTLVGAIDRQTAQPKYRHVVMSEFPGQLGWNASELDCTGAYGIEAKDSRVAWGSDRHERLGATRIVVLPGELG